MLKRSIFKVLVSRMSEKRRFVQILAGPRQTGKTTLAKQLIKEFANPCHYASADEPALKDQSWIEQQWEAARQQCTGTKKEAILILDEVQKVQGWSETVKRLWDQDSVRNRHVKVMLLGSSQLRIGQGATESLAGRFEVIPVTHWTFEEMQRAFGWRPDQYIFHGGYPGSAEILKDFQRWVEYIKTSLIESVISRDILLMSRIDKPALMRRLFDLGCSYSGQILSYQKMLGQLHDAGNTTTLAHYLDLLGKAGLIVGLHKYAGEHVRQRASSPKLLILNTALMAVHSGFTIEEAKAEQGTWGRFVETAIGAHLSNGAVGTGIDLYYWNAGSREVDFVLKKGKKLIAIEVKSGRKGTSLPGITEFSNKYEVFKKLLVGADGIPVERFLLTPVQKLFE